MSQMSIVLAEMKKEKATHISKYIGGVAARQVEAILKKQKEYQSNSLLLIFTITKFYCQRRRMFEEPSNRYCKESL